MNKKLIPILVSSLGLTLAIAPLAQAEKSKRHHQNHNNQHNQTVDYARVINVNPIYDTVEYSKPYKECRYEERVVRKRRDSNTAIILGSIIGGAIGTEIGPNKSNKRAGTVAVSSPHLTHPTRFRVYFLLVGVVSK